MTMTRYRFASSFRYETSADWALLSCDDSDLHMPIFGIYIGDDFESINKLFFKRKWLI